ncbi:hypothetical protein DM01DRAFT_1331950 [Hesseltinella vesiculosa]|uniref:Uncharacterized protein n=1 Tax=Hesseltinella vesiculosa TaxID=101127 RepID=A0A1X2GTF2_9FUNG|nr:hypothetical protein DM01DRAFT_1331950 [Hesseltinella vesiculosa]
MPGLQICSPVAWHLLRGVDKTNQDLLQMHIETWFIHVTRRCCLEEPVTLALLRMTVD